MFFSIASELTNRSNLKWGSTNTSQTSSKCFWKKKPLKSYVQPIQTRLKLRKGRDASVPRVDVSKTIVSVLQMERFVVMNALVWHVEIMMILAIPLQVMREQANKASLLWVLSPAVFVEVVIVRNHNAKNVTVSVIHLVLLVHNNVVV